MKKNVAIGVGIAAAVVVIGGGTAFALNGMGGGGSANSKFLQYNQQVLKEKTDFLSQFIGSAATAKTVDKTITITADVTGNSSAATSFNSALKDSSITMKMKGDEKNAVMGMNLHLMGSDLLDMTTTVDASQNLIGFYIPAADEKYYTFDLNKLYKNLYNEDTNFSLQGNRTLSEKELEDLMKPYMDIFANAVKGSKIVVEKNKEVSQDYLADKFTGDTYSFKPTQQEIEKTLNTLADTLEKDTKLVDFLKKYNYNASSLQQLNQQLGVTDDDGKDPAKTLQALAKKIRDNAASTSKTMADNGFHWTVAVEKNQVKQIRIGTEKVSDFVYEIKQADNTTTSAYYVSTDKDQGISNSVKKDGNKVTGDLTANVEHQSIKFSYDVDTSKKDALLAYGSYSIQEENVAKTSANLTIGPGANGGTEYALNLNDISSTTGSSGIDGINLHFNVTDGADVSAPSIAPTDISDYSQEDLQKLFSGMAEKLYPSFFKAFSQLSSL